MTKFTSLIIPFSIIATLCSLPILAIGQENDCSMIQNSMTKQDAVKAIKQMAGKEQDEQVQPNTTTSAPSVNVTTGTFATDSIVTKGMF